MSELTAFLTRYNYHLCDENVAAGDVMDKTVAFACVLVDKFVAARGHGNAREQDDRSRPDDREQEKSPPSEIHPGPCPRGAGRVRPRGFTTLVTWLSHYPILTLSNKPVTPPFDQMQHGS